MTKTISKTIRLLIATALFAVLFSLNTGAMPLGTDGHGYVTNQSVELGWIAQAHAQTPPPPPPPTPAPDAGAPSAPPLVTAEGNVPEPPNPQKMLETVAKAATYVNLIFNPLIHFITFRIGAFLGNDYIFAGKMGEMLHNIWIINRNICNIVFVLVLLYLALKYIIYGDESGIAKNLGKFAIMLVAINFSWLAGRLILDAANVATNVVFAIPAGISGVAGDTFDKVLAEDKNQCKVNIKDGVGYKTVGYCTAVSESSFLTLDATETLNFMDKDPQCNKDAVKETETKYENIYNNKDGFAAYPEPGINKTNRICWQQMKLSDYQQNNASYYLSYSMAKVQNLVRANNKDALNTAVGTLFSLALQIAYLAGFLSLFLVLIMRACLMWLLMAFSPYTVLLLLLGMVAHKPGMGQAGEFLTIETFIGWAFVPAMVGAVWSIGFIMITAGQVMDPSSFERIATHIYGAGTLFMGMDTVQQFIWYMMSLGIIWIGTFSVFSSVKGASIVTDRIKGGVEKLGKFGGAVFAEKVPLFPVHDDKGGGKTLTTNEMLGKWKDWKGEMTGNKGGGGGGTALQSLDKERIEVLVKLSSDGAKFEEIKKDLTKLGLDTIDKINSQTSTILESERYGKDKGERQNFIDKMKIVISTPTASVPVPAPPPPAAGPQPTATGPNP